MNFGKHVVVAGYSLQWPRMCHLIVPKIGFENLINKWPAAKFQNPKIEV